MIVEKSTRRQTHRLQREDTDTPEQGAVTASIKMYIAFQAPAASSLVRPPALHGQLPSNLLSALFPKGKNTKPPPGVLPAPGMLSSHSGGHLLYKPYVGYLLYQEKAFLVEKSSLRFLLQMYLRSINMKPAVFFSPLPMIFKLIIFLEAKRKVL